MPNYGIAQAGSNPATPAVATGAAGQPGGFNLTTLCPGDTYILFAAEAPATGQASVAVALQPHPAGYRPIAFEFLYSAAPGGDSCAIQGSMSDVDSEYQTLYTSPGANASGTHDFYSDLGKFSFYRAKQISRAGVQTNTVTVAG